MLRTDSDYGQTLNNLIDFGTLMITAVGTEQPTNFLVFQDLIERYIEILKRLYFPNNILKRRFQMLIEQKKELQLNAKYIY